MGTDVKSQGIEPVLVEERIINMCVRFACSILPRGFLPWSRQSPGAAS